jgi:hypothetical protein
LRENEHWHADLEKQAQVDRLDDLLAKAKERLQKREEARARAKAEATPKVRKNVKPGPTLPTPEQDPEDIWDSMLPQEKKP